ncbi:hypothetical protein [Pseudoalteromonas sp. H105]|jgi:hypothetical protein|uniref:hypothetical protein n=1 Tax=Pseudoalteromonas sp. H105 TaxID=1348393 RepID=UPI0007322605|nr:hypothetical protein [Pseudoalteromonas sp. H105]KTF13959.1 hypothetical protein ATS75_12595 [Pseudoalteromonas sp. H105]
MRDERTIKLLCFNRCEDISIKLSIRIVVVLFALIGFAGSSVVGYFLLTGNKSTELISSDEINRFNGKLSVDRKHPINVAIHFIQFNESNLTSDYVDNVDTEISMFSEAERFEVAEVEVEQSGFLDDSLFYRAHTFTMNKRNEKWYIGSVKVTSK